MRYIALLHGQKPTGLVRYESGIAEHLGADGNWHVGGIERVVDEVTDTSAISQEEASLIAASLGAHGAV